MNSAGIAPRLGDEAHPKRAESLPYALQAGAGAHGH